MVGDNVLSGTVTSMDDLIGMQARRVLHAGESVRADDVRRPTLVVKGSDRHHDLRGSWHHADGRRARNERRRDWAKPSLFRIPLRFGRSAPS